MDNVTRFQSNPVTSLVGESVSEAILDRRGLNAADKLSLATAFAQASAEERRETPALVEFFFANLRVRAGGQPGDNFFGIDDMRRDVDAIVKATTPKDVSDRDHPIIATILDALTKGTDEPIALDREGQASIEAELRRLIGNVELALAVSALFSFAHFISSKGSPRAAGALVDVALRMQHAVHALRVRTAGEDPRRRPVGEALRKFSGDRASPRAPAQTVRPINHQLALLAGSGSKKK